MPIPAHVAPRLRVDRANARAGLSRDPQLANVTDAELDAALAGIDQDALYDTKRAALVPVVWDRTSPVNGVPAEEVLARRDDVPAEGDVYLIRDVDGRVLVFQPHEPDVEGLVAVPVGQGLEKGKGHADRMAADEAAGEVLRRVREAILAKRATP